MVNCPFLDNSLEQRNIATPVSTKLPATPLYWPATIHRAVIVTWSARLYFKHHWWMLVCPTAYCLRNGKHTSLIWFRATTKIIDIPWIFSTLHGHYKTKQKISPCINSSQFSHGKQKSLIIKILVQFIFFVWHTKKQHI